MMTDSIVSLESAWWGIVSLAILFILAHVHREIHRQNDRIFELSSRIEEIERKMSLSTVESRDREQSSKQKLNTEALSLLKEIRDFLKMESARE